jgi:hypothetical protein
MLRVALMAGVLLLATAASFAAPVPKGVKAKAVVRKKIEPLPGEKFFSVNFDDMPFEKVVEVLEKHSGLMFLSKEMPKQRLTLKADEVCMAELFAQLNDELEPKGYILARKTQSFTVLKTDTPLNRVLCPTILPEKLSRWSDQEPVQLYLPVGEEGVEAGLKIGKAVEDKWFTVEAVGTDKLLVRGHAKDVRKFVDDMPPPPSREELVEQILRKKGLK